MFSLFCYKGKKIHIKSQKKEKQSLENGDCLWISAFTEHGFTGNGFY